MDATPVAMVTGSEHGIGFACAKALAALQYGAGVDLDHRPDPRPGRSSRDGECEPEPAIPMTTIPSGGAATSAPPWASVSLSVRSLKPLRPPIQLRHLNE